MTINSVDVLAEMDLAINMLRADGYGGVASDLQAARDAVAGLMAAADNVVAYRNRQECRQPDCKCGAQAAFDDIEQNLAACAGAGSHDQV